MDGAKIRGCAGQCHHRDTQRSVDLVQIEHVETADYYPVEENRLETFETAGRPHEADHLVRPVGTVDPDPAHADRLDPVGGCDRDRRDRGPATLPPECTVVHADDPHVHFLEFWPQR